MDSSNIAFSGSKNSSMLNAEYFLKNGGQRGPQAIKLKPGEYMLNQYVFDVDATEKATTEVVWYDPTAEPETDASDSDERDGISESFSRIVWLGSVLYLTLY